MAEALVKQKKKPYMVINPPEIQFDSGIEGIHFDFNNGARVTVPKGDYRVKFIDRDVFLTVYDMPASGVIVTSSKLYYVNFRIEVYQGKELIFSHDYDAKGKNVLLKFPDNALGDMLAWFPYAEEFRKKHDCNLFVMIGEKFRSIFQDNYPNINFVEYDAYPENLYATYYVGLFEPWDNRDVQPTDWRYVGLQGQASRILGLPDKEIRPVLRPKKKFQSDKPYVCIATQASAQCKYWNNAAGWLEVVDYLKSLGYRVLCMDQQRSTVNGLYGNNLPYGCEDFTGNLPLQERIDVIAGAEFFIGLSSGLTWVAWGTGVPIVMIVGFTKPGTEFYTPYRVQQFHTCNSCMNSAGDEHQKSNYAVCPYHHGTPREFECTRCISPDYVKATIDRLIEDIERKDQ